jgi:hypothetical protein
MMCSTPEPERYIPSVIAWLDERAAQLIIALNANYVVFRIYVGYAIVTMEFDRLKIVECNEAALLMVVKKVVSQVVPSVIIEVLNGGD